MTESKSCNKVYEYLQLLFLVSIILTRAIVEKESPESFYKTYYRKLFKSFANLILSVSYHCITNHIKP